MSDDADKIAFSYRKDRNEDEKGTPIAALPGVPLRSLTVREFLEQPEWLQDSIRAQPYYVATANAPKAKAKAEGEAPTPQPDGAADDTLGAAPAEDSPDAGGPPARRSRTADKADKAPAEG